MVVQRQLPGAPHGGFIVLESEVVLAMSLCVASNFIERLVAVQGAMDAAFAKANRESKRTRSYCSRVRLVEPRLRKLDSEWNSSGGGLMKDPRAQDARVADVEGSGSSPGTALTAGAKAGRRLQRTDAPTALPIGRPNSDDITPLRQLKLNTASQTLPIAVRAVQRRARRRCSSL